MDLDSYAIDTREDLVAAIMEIAQIVYYGRGMTDDEIQAQLDPLRATNDNEDEQ